MQCFHVMSQDPIEFFRARVESHLIFSRFSTYGHRKIESNISPTQAFSPRDTFDADQAACGQSAAKRSTSGQHQQSRSKVWSSVPTIEDGLAAPHVFCYHCHSY